MTLVINQILYQKESIDDQTKEIEKKETTKEKNNTEESTMFLWNSCLESDDEQSEEIFVGDTIIIKSDPKYYNLCNKGVITSTPIPSKIIPTPRKINPPTSTQNPNILSQAINNPNN
jgi:hypothetical protein